MVDNPFDEENFPCLQSKAPLAEHEAFSSFSLVLYLTEETGRWDSRLITSCFQALAEGKESPLLQAKQLLFPQLLLIKLCALHPSWRMSNLPGLVCPSGLFPKCPLHVQCSSPDGHISFLALHLLPSLWLKDLFHDCIPQMISNSPFLFTNN